MKRIGIFLLIFISVIVFKSSTIYAETLYQAEILVQRTTNGKVYSLGNSIFRYELYTEPIHYYNGDEYVEFENEIIYSENEEKYVTKKANYQVEVSNKIEDKGQVTIEYLDIYNVQLDFSTNLEENITEINLENSNCFQFNYSDLSVISFVSENTQFKSIYSINTINSDRSFRFTISSSDLVLKEVEGQYYFVDKANAPIFEFEEYYMVDSIGNISTNTKTNVAVSTYGYEVVLTASNDFLDDENIAYPVTLVGGITYSTVVNNYWYRDKTIVKDTSEGYDSSIFTVSKQKYYPFQNTPIQLDEYLLYSIVEINLTNFVGTGITVTDANLQIERIQSNVNAKLPLSEVTSAEYNDIDGYTNYSKILISNPFVSSNTISYDVTLEVISHINNGDSILLLELSPEFILLGLSSLRYMNFRSENANQSDSPFLTIEYVSPITGDFGDAPDYYDTNSAILNCFGYALRKTDEWINIYNATGVINFGNIQVDEQYFQNTIVPAVIYTIEDQLFYSVRQLSSFDDAVYSNEYRIALRIGDIYSTSNYHIFYPSGENRYSTDDFHFMIQLEDGNWASKPGQLQSEELPLGLYIDNSNWNKNLIYITPVDFFENFYNSTTVYFAISHSKPVLYGW